MPLFGNKKPQKGGIDATENGNNGISSEDDRRKTDAMGQEETRAQQIARQLSFSVQLAHGSPTMKIADFCNVKELYQRIAEGFGIDVTQILYCTLNTPKVNMEKLLGGQIGLEDLIFAHCKGAVKEVTISKNAPVLGLTITDNGNGFAFIKRIRPESVAAKYPDVSVGDHIAMINGRNVVGCRHFEVAKILRDFQEGTTFSMKLVETQKGFGGIGPRQGKGSTSNNADIGSGRATLRLRSKGPAVLEEQPSWEAKAIAKIDDLLETFIGIRDPELANTLIDLGKNLENPSDYALAIDGQLEDFEFPDEVIFDCWGAINDAKAGRI